MLCNHVHQLTRSQVSTCSSYDRATMVNIRTHRLTAFDQLISTAQPAELKILPFFCCAAAGSTGPTESGTAGTITGGSSNSPPGSLAKFSPITCTCHIDLTITFCYQQTITQIQCTATLCSSSTHFSPPSQPNI